MKYSNLGGPHYRRGRRCVEDALRGQGGTGSRRGRDHPERGRSGSRYAARRSSSARSTVCASGDTHYTPVAGREPLREAIAHAHRARTGQAVEAANVIFLAGAQNALFAASLCLAGPGDEVLALRAALSDLSCDHRGLGRAHGAGAGTAARRVSELDLAALEAAITPRTRAIFFATPNNPSGVVMSDGGACRHRRPGASVTRSGWWRMRCMRDLRRAGACRALRRACPSEWSPSAACPRPTPCPAGAPDGWSDPRALIAHAEALAMCMLYGLPGFIQEAALTALGVAAEAESRTREFCANRLRVGARGARRCSRAASACTGCRHVHADRRARLRSVGLRIHVRAVSIGTGVGARRRRLR